MKLLILSTILLVSSLAQALNEPKILTTLEKATVLALLTESEDLHPSYQNDLKQLFSDAVYDYRASISEFKCEKIGRSSIVRCDIQVSTDNSIDEDKGWGSVYKIEAMLNIKNTIQLVSARSEGLAG